MGERQVAKMRLKVDLQCDKCFRKVKKVLCKFPQIRDQTYDEKHNTVTIKVVCCSPEKVRDKLCYYGGGFIKSIEIVEIHKPRPPGGGVIVVEQPPRPTPRAEPVKPATPPPAPPPEPQKQDDTAKPPPAVKFPEPVPVSVLAYPYPSPAASVGRGLGWPAGFYGTPIYDSYGGNGSSFLGYQYQDLHVEEDASVCTIA